MGDDQESGSADTMAERVPESRVKLWLLLDANRWLLAGGLALSVFLLVLLTGVAGREPVVEGRIPNLFEPLITALITGVTIVVTINQLVLSQELGSAGDQRERMSGALSFRREVEAALDVETSPTDPGQFLAALVTASSERAGRLRVVLDTDDADLTEDIERFVADLRENAAEASDRLETAEFGTFQVVDAAIDFDYSLKLHETRRFQASVADDLNEEATETLAALADLLELYGVAREHVKTLYFQWDLIDLSRSILYAAVPALLVAAAMVLLVDAEGVTGSVGGIDTLVWLVGAALAVSLLPFFLLLMYVLRIVTVAKRTLAIGPFILRTRDQSDDNEES